jgi:hypothetical protein
VKQPVRSVAPKIPQGGGSAVRDRSTDGGQDDQVSVPPGYRHTKPPVKPKLGAFIAIIDGILTEDKGRPKKQQHTAKRIFERLRDEPGFEGGLTITKDCVAGWRQPARETFVQLAHAPR